ncbi:MAG: preprotein translocase subunit YajC [Alphaproteobacteria bacterium]|nr:preprotein translocase subunit YajC [Alphaproteobacteria bacterium]
MFISEAFAQTATDVSQAGMVGAQWSSAIIQVFLIVFILYFFLIRPQQKRMKEHQARLNGIVKGTKIVISGIVGTVTKAKDNELTVSIASGVEITVLREYVSQVFIDEPKKNK